MANIMVRELDENDIIYSNDVDSVYEITLKYSE